MSLSMICGFLRTKFWKFAFPILRFTQSLMAWVLRRRNRLSLFDLPVELRRMVYDEVARGAEAPNDLEGLGTCKTLYQGLNATLAQLRSSVVHNIDDQYWWSANAMARDQILYEALTQADRRDIDIVKFTGDDNKLYNWAPHLALLTLATRHIRPSTVILFDAFTRHPATHDIDAIANVTDRLLTLATAQQLPIRMIKICNVPQDLVFFLGCRLLNLGFIPNMDIEAMTDDLSANFQSTANTYIAIKVPLPSTSGTIIAVVTVHITKLTK